MTDDEKHNISLIILVGIVVETCIVCSAYLSMHGKDYAALIAVGGAFAGILTGSGLRPKTPPTTTIPDSSGVVNVNVPPPVVTTETGKV